MTTTILTYAEKDKFVADIIGYGTDFVTPIYGVVESIEQAVLQSPEIQALRKDAERYRYLRQAGVDYSTDLDVFDAEGNCLNEEELDVAVDAAMERKT